MEYLTSINENLERGYIFKKLYDDFMIFSYDKFIITNFQS